MGSISPSSGIRLTFSGFGHSRRPPGTADSDPFQTLGRRCKVVMRFSGSSRMATKLHSTLEGYFAAANRHDVDGMIAAFADDAVVNDEGHEQRDASGIR